MKKLIPLLLILILLPGFIILSKNNAQKNKTKFLLNTICSITIFETSRPVNREALIDNCFELCMYYESKLSKTVEESEISKINNSKGEWITVSDDVILLLKKSIQYGDYTSGLFDITIGSVTKLWGFASDNFIMPSDDSIKEAVNHVNYKNILIKNNSVMLADTDAIVDLGAVAKGYIGDIAAEFLKNNHVTSAIINLGGNIITIGGHPKKTNFKIGLKKPFSEDKDIFGYVSINDKSVVTTGIYERYFEYDNKIFHHILDPETGYPIENNLYSVTIISKSSTDSDILSTCCFLLGAEKGMDFIENTAAAEAIFYLSDGSVLCSSGINRGEILFEMYEDS